MKIVVIGGTGLIGSSLVTKLRERGHDPVAASPATGVDAISGEGLSEALRGAEVVVDVSNAPDWADDAVMHFFQTSSRNLLAAEAAAGVGHHVALSVVGSDRLSESGYFRAKIAQEELIRSSSIPYTIVHATQFFEFVEGIADAATDANTVRLPPALFQPMASDDVASAVGRAAVGPPILVRSSQTRRRASSGSRRASARYCPAMTHAWGRPVSRTGSDSSRARPAEPTHMRSRTPAMHEIRVSIVSPEEADYGVAELWAAGEMIGHTIFEDTDLMFRIMPRRDRTPVVVGARSLARALTEAEQLLERY
jgi:uncharacterized protein YbjT (DUF2867 family)